MKVDLRVDSQMEDNMPIAPKMRRRLASAYDSDSDKEASEFVPSFLNLILLKLVHLSIKFLLV